ncbi:MAG: 50S ribosomal protein L10 [Acidobacteria bacterium]|jgi:large subunit ribosomal protein L10|nr:50S ribosomal protein L10 [Acidobacteriota bacterium]
MPSTETLDRKKKQVDEIAEIFNNNGVYLFDYRGLTVAQMNTLRNRVKELNADLKVIKNRLAIKHFERENLGIGRDIFNGPTAVAFANENFVEVAKTLVDYEKENDKVKIKAGFIEKQFADKEKVKYVAKLPAKEVLLAQLVGAIAMPLKKMGMALSAPLLNMLILMNNLKDKKENEEKNNG